MTSGFIVLSAILSFLLFIIAVILLFVYRREFDNDNLFKAAQIFATIGGSILVMAGIFLGLSFNYLNSAPELVSKGTSLGLALKNATAGEGMFSLAGGYIELSMISTELAVSFFMMGIVLCVISFIMALMGLRKSVENKKRS